MSLTHLGPDEIARRMYRGRQAHCAARSPNDFSAAHVEQFKEIGFVAIEDVFTPADVEAAKASLSRLVAQGNPDVVSFEDAANDRELSPDEREGYVRKIWHFVGHDGNLAAMSSHPVLVSIVERLLGSPVKLIQDMALLKPAHVGREKPWHQDNAYFVYQPLELVIGTWIALDPATVENGCMHVIPGSHRDGPRPHFHDRDCQLSDDDVAVERDVVVPLPPGGAMFFSSLLHHGTPPNRSPQRRRALQFHYASVNCTTMSGAAHQALFEHDGRYAGCATYATGGKLLPIAERKI